MLTRTDKLLIGSLAFVAVSGLGVLLAVYNLNRIGYEVKNSQSNEQTLVKAINEDKEKISLLNERVMILEATDMKAMCAAYSSTRKITNTASLVITKDPKGVPHVTCYVKYLALDHKIPDQNIGPVTLTKKLAEDPESFRKFHQLKDGTK